MTKFFMQLICFSVMYFYLIIIIIIIIIIIVNYVYALALAKCNMCMQGLIKFTHPLSE